MVMAETNDRIVAVVIDSVVTEMQVMALVSVNLLNWFWSDSE